MNNKERREAWILYAEFLERSDAEHRFATLYKKFKEAEAQNAKTKVPTRYVQLSQE